ncbi:hypothetical protein ACISSW_25795, partial [Escherichia coli]
MLLLSGMPVPRKKARGAREKDREKRHRVPGRGFVFKKQTRMVFHTATTPLTIFLFLAPVIPPEKKKHRQQQASTTSN